MEEKKRKNYLEVVLVIIIILASAYYFTLNNELTEAEEWLETNKETIEEIFTGTDIEVEVGKDQKILFVGNGKPDEDTKQKIIKVITELRPPVEHSVVEKD